MRIGLDPDPWIEAQPLIQIQHRRLFRAVVHDHQFEGGIRRLFEDILGDPRDQVEPVAGGDDDANERCRVRQRPLKIEAAVPERRTRRRSRAAQVQVEARRAGGRINRDGLATAQDAGDVGDTGRGTGRKIEGDGQSIGAIHRLGGQSGEEVPDDQRGRADIAHGKRQIGAPIRLEARLRRPTGGLLVGINHLGRLGLPALGKQVQRLGRQDVAGAEQAEQVGPSGKLAQRRGRIPGRGEHAPVNSRARRRGAVRPGDEQRPVLMGLGA
ncbi:UNVERIFIED_ORG: hypothetical protein M2442_000888 [Methylorubrum zatmanii]|nr:hypothetical protein [Methylorubrum zatmanii]